MAPMRAAVVSTLVSTFLVVGVGLFVVLAGTLLGLLIGQWLLQ